MGRILADCLVGLPLMRELNLRDNRLTDKGLMPIVKVNESKASRANYLFQDWELCQLCPYESV